MSDTKPKPAVPATPETAPEARFEWTESPFERFLEQHFKKMLIALVAVAVAVGTWLVMRQQAERKAVEQAEAFTNAETLDDYKKVIANHPGSVAAGSAQLMIANLLAQNNDTTGALEELKKFTSGFPQHPMVEQAAFRIATLIAEKDGAEAGVREYDSFIERFPNSPFRPLAQMRKGDALVTLGKRDEAVALFEAIQKDASLFGEPILAEAKSRAEQVKLQPPTEVEFVPEPEPAPGPPPASTGLDFDLSSPANPIIPTDATSQPEPTPAPDTGTESTAQADPSADADPAPPPTDAADAPSAGATEPPAPDLAAPAPEAPTPQ